MTRYGVLVAASFGILLAGTSLTRAQSAVDCGKARIGSIEAALCQPTATIANTNSSQSDIGTRGPRNAGGNGASRGNNGSGAPSASNGSGNNGPSGNGNSNSGSGDN